MNDTKKLKQIINGFYGRMGTGNAVYVDTDSILVHDCDFCRNAYTCDDLRHDNDLSYMACGRVDKGVRMLFRSDDKSPTELIVEELRTTGINHQGLEWTMIARFKPNYCPFCGRPLFENHIKRRNNNE